jgi:branched-chain amino acid transport system permease protein
MFGATLLSGLAIGSVYSLIAIGFSLIFRATGLINFAQGEMATIGALVGYSLVSEVGLPFLGAFPIVMLTGALASLAIERLVLRPMRHSGVPEVNMVIATVGLILIISHGAKLIWGAQALSYTEGLASGIVRMGHVVISLQNVAIFALGLGLMLALHLFLHRTRAGRGMRAAATDPLMASLSGIDVNRARSVTAAFSGALGAAAGALLAPMYYASYDTGFIAFKAFCAAVLGGFGHIPGAMIGGILVGEIETLGAIYISSEYKDAIVYGLLIVLLLVRPSGILGGSAWRST